MQIFFPTVDGADEKKGIIGHYFAITVNIKEERFELLDSNPPYADNVKEYFHAVTSKLKKIWKQISSKLNLTPSNIDHFEKVIVEVPEQGAT